MTPPNDAGGLSEFANRDELQYREQVQPITDSPEKFLRKIRASGRLALLDHLRSRGIAAPAGDVLEIGAGSGWLSAQLSRVPGVTQVVATDFSPRLVNEVMPFIARSLDADMDRLERRVADFHQLPFAAESFDWVFADSALHHASDVVRLLGEVRRVLRPSGRLVAVREPVRPLLAAWQLRARREVVDELSAHGVDEPLFSRREWNRFFAAAGLEATWHGVSFSTGLRRLAALGANGIVRADYCIVGTRRRA